MTLSLEAFRTRLEPIEIAKDRVVPVRAIDGIAWDMAEEVDRLRQQGDHVAAIRKLREIVDYLLPDATADEVNRLETGQLNAVVRYAGGETITALEAERGNGSGAGSEPQAAAPARESKGSRNSNRSRRSSTRS